MKKGFRIGYILLFFALLCLPLLLMPFFKNDASLEKRSLARFPSYLSEGELNLGFSDQFESWLSDHLPLRSQLLTVSGALRGELLQEQTSNVIAGKEGWLFYASEAEDYMDVNAMSDARLRALAVTLSLLQEQTEGAGGHFTFVPVPNKSSVYGEYMPARYRRAQENNLKRLQALLPEYGVHFTDMLAVLTEAREAGVYHRRDSHWNYRGALLGASAILDSLGRSHGDWSGLPFSVEKNWRGDLDKLLLPAGGVMDEQIVYEASHAAFTFRQPRGVEDPQAQLESFMSDREERDMLFVTENGEKRDGSNLFMARDSFGRALLPWMIDSYETATFRRTGAPDLRFLPGETDVVFEIAERNLESILQKAPMLYAPVREGIEAEGLPAGELLRTAADLSDDRQICGVFPADTLPGDGRVYLLLEREGETVCLEAFPICEKSLFPEGESGFSAYLSPELELSGRYRMTVVAGGTVYPCEPVDF
jgi:hypothetical protein